MKTNDPRENSFSAARFRDAIDFAMSMGIPQDESHRVTFVWKGTKAYTDADTRRSPYDWTDTPSATTTATDVPLSLAVPAAVEFYDAKSASGESAMGDFDIGRVRITMLDTSYAQLVDDVLGLPDECSIDGATYTVDYWMPPMGLFDVTIHTCFAAALDES